MTTKKYTYGFYSYFMGFAYIIMIGTLLVRLIIAWGRWVKVIFWDRTFDITPEMHFELIVFGFSFIWAMLAVSGVMNAYPHFKVADEGIYVRIFKYWFRWKLIPWDKVKDLYKSPKRSTIWILLVDMPLTYWHIKISDVYGYGVDTEIPIMHNLVGARNFRARVRKILEKNKTNFNDNVV